MTDTHQREYWDGRDRRGARCRNCGRTRQQAASIDVHHIGDGEVDDRDNLVALCRRCHFRAQHDRDDVPGESPLAPDRPRRTGPRRPSCTSPR